MSKQASPIKLSGGGVQTTGTGADSPYNQQQPQLKQGGLGSGMPI